jgi:hypothetical protein
MEGRFSTSKSFADPLVLKLHPITWWTLDRSPVDEEKPAYISSTIILDKLTADDNRGHEGFAETAGAKLTLSL